MPKRRCRCATTGGRSRTTTAKASTPTPVNCAGCSERFRLVASASPRRSSFGYGSSQADQAARQEEGRANLAQAAEAALPGHELRRNGPAEALERADPLHEQLDERCRVDADRDLRVR